MKIYNFSLKITGVWNLSIILYTIKNTSVHEKKVENENFFGQVIPTHHFLEHMLQSIIEDIWYLLDDVVHKFLHWCGLTSVRFSFQKNYNNIKVSNRTISMANSLLLYKKLFETWKTPADLKICFADKNNMLSHLLLFQFYKL